MLNKYFSGTKETVNTGIKQSDSAREVERLARKTKEMVPWLDP